MNLGRKIEMVDMGNQILEHYGIENQLSKLVEEMGELTVELMKMRTGEHPDNDRMMNELADVLNIAMQILMVWDIEPYDINERMYAKLERQIERIEKIKTTEAELTDSKEIDLSNINLEADDFKPIE